MEEINDKFLLVEYEKLKDEQHKRIEFRDHMIYLTLVGIGAVFSFAIEKPNFNIAFLVLPFMCIVLGWTYLANDEKISAIGNYIRIKLLPKILKHETDNSEVINWEEFLKFDKKRKQRKIIQLIVDISVFCISGLISVTCYLFLHKDFYWYHILLITLEVVFLFYLCYQFIFYADIKK